MRSFWCTLIFILLNTIVTVTTFAMEESACKKRKRETNFQELEEQEKSGSIDAACKLGKLYLAGKETDRNVKMAKEYYRKASSRHSFVACVKLGRIYSGANLKALDAKLDVEYANDYFDSAYAYWCDSQSFEVVRDHPKLYLDLVVHYCGRQDDNKAFENVFSLLGYLIDIIKKEENPYQERHFDEVINMATGLCENISNPISVANGIKVLIHLSKLNITNAQNKICDYYYRDFKINYSDIEGFKTRTANDDYHPLCKDVLFQLAEAHFDSLEKIAYGFCSGFEDQQVLIQGAKLITYLFVGGIYYQVTQMPLSNDLTRKLLEIAEHLFRYKADRDAMTVGIQIMFYLSNFCCNDASFSLARLYADGFNGDDTFVHRNQDGFVRDEGAAELCGLSAMNSYSLTLLSFGKSNYEDYLKYRGNPDGLEIEFLTATVRCYVRAIRLGNRDAEAKLKEISSEPIIKNSPFSDVRLWLKNEEEKKALRLAILNASVMQGIDLPQETGSLNPTEGTYEPN